MIKENSGRKLKIILEIGITIILIIGVLALFNAYKAGHFDSVDTLKEYVASFGALGPLIMVLIRAMLVIAPIFPSPILVCASAVMFGPWKCFIFTYIGNLIGATVAYWLGAFYGPKFVKSLISEKAYNKCVEKIAGKKNFDIFYAIAISTPMFPDDILCYFCGLGQQTYKRFILINLCCKPITIGLYCLVFGGVIPLFDI